MTPAATTDDELRAIAEAATPGPWEEGYLDKNDQSVVISAHIEIATCWHHCVGSLEKEMRANAAFIAAARTAVPELLDRLAAAEARVAVLEGALEPFARVADYSGTAWHNYRLLAHLAAPNDLTIGHCRRARAALKGTVMTDRPTVEQLPHEYGPSKVGHGEAQCIWCLGTNRENVILNPNYCDVRTRKASLTQQPRPDASVDGLAATVEAMLWANLDLVNHRTEAVRELAQRLTALTTRAIPLTKAETQSGHDRVKWAEGLIIQLPETHDGRNSWLLNYGVGEEANERRAAWIERHPHYGIGAFDKLFPAIRSLAAKEVE